LDKETIAKGEFMKNRMWKHLAVTLMGTALVAAIGAAEAKPASGYHLLKKTVLGGEGFWDYLTLDVKNRTLYIAHNDRVEIVNVDGGARSEAITGLAGVHGVALAPEYGRGFISSGRSDTLTVFDLKTGRKTAEVKTGANPDAVLYDGYSRRVFTFNGRSSDATAVDAAGAAVCGTLPLGGKPEFAASDGKGNVFVNIEDSGEIVNFDPRTLQVLRRWKLAPGEEPSGLALDEENGRLFSACANRLLVVSDCRTGAVVCTVPIGGGSDGVKFDPGSRLIFSSNGEGTLTVIHQDAADKYSVRETVPTARGARTLAVDPQTHHVFLVTAEFGPVPAATPEHPRPRPAVLPGTFALLEFAE
jgi:DNA-binding beta-propeller fold protein YncE